MASVPETLGVAVGCCRDCGGPKPIGKGRKLCDSCREKCEARKRRLRPVRQRRYYERNRDEVLARNRAWREANPDKVRRGREAIYRLEVSSGSRHRRNLAKYGLTIEDYECLLTFQGGVCAICGRNDGKRRLNVDHCHETGEVRGLLCSGCNGSKLGRLKHDVRLMEERAEELEARAGRLRRAIGYLDDPPAKRALGGDV